MKAYSDRYQNPDVETTTIGVLIVTYKRSRNLLRCLEGLRKQTLPPNDVIVVVRVNDAETRVCCLALNRDNLNLRVVLVDSPSTVVARNFGIEKCETDILAMIDDDAVPRVDWLERIVDHFQADSNLGGVGGKNRKFDGYLFNESKADIVGKLEWYGKPIGNFHLGYGPVRETDMLTGANMSFRRTVFQQIRFNDKLRGTGSVPFADICFCLAAKHSGWKLIYDPEIIVEHYVGNRTELWLYNNTVTNNLISLQDSAYNEVVSVWPFLSPMQRCAFLVYATVIGSFDCPGWWNAILATHRLGTLSWKKFIAVQRGIFQALSTGIH